MGALRVVTLVPWRAGEFRRVRNYNVVRPYLEAMNWPIFEGDSDGPWARARAVNAAARAAGDWDVALISDADTVGEPETLERAVEEALRTNGGIRPHSNLWMLSPEQSADFARFGRQGTVINFKTQNNKGGGLMVVSRAAWDIVGGYDEEFVDWGHEDSHFNTRLLAHAHWDILDGNAYHLWHPRSTEKTPAVLANAKRMRLIQMEHHEVIRAESIKRGWDVGAHL